MERQLRLLTNTGDIVWGVDQNHRIVLWNEAAAQHLGYSAPEVKGMPCYELLQGCSLQGSQSCQQKCALMMQTRRDTPLEAQDLVMRHANGHSVTLNVSTMAVPQDARDSLNLALLHTSRPTRRKETNPGLRIQLLGPIAVTRPDGTAVSGRLWHRVKVRALLAYLALQRGLPIPREQLVDVLWPELSYEAALRNLNTTVYKLRRSLEPTLRNGRESRYIQYEAGQYWLDGIKQHWLDIDEVENSLNRARRTAVGPAALAAYERILTWMRGPFLADLTGTDVWSATDAERYQLIWLEALEASARLYLESGDSARAHDLNFQILAIDPLHERTHQRILSHLIEHGDRPTAIAHYRQFRSDLARELGLTPAKATQELYATARAL